MESLGILTGLLDRSSIASGLGYNTGALAKRMAFLGSISFWVAQFQTLNPQTRAYKPTIAKYVGNNRPSQRSAQIATGGHQRACKLQSKQVLGFSDRLRV